MYSYWQKYYPGSDRNESVTYYLGGVLGLLASELGLGVSVKNVN
jgi:hypothetical protein